MIGYAWFRLLFILSLFLPVGYCILFVVNCLVRLCLYLFIAG